MNRRAEAIRAVQGACEVDIIDDEVTVIFMPHHAIAGLDMNDAKDLRKALDEAICVWESSESEKEEDVKMHPRAEHILRGLGDPGRDYNG
jgi:hypothetical protein